MTRPLLYIAAPYGDPSPTIRAWHTDRAALLGKLAFACGYVPIVVHTSIAAGVYGDDSDPEQRAAGMAATLDVCRAVVAGGGGLWALLRDGGTFSDGTRTEHDESLSSVVACRSGMWSGWRHECERSAPALLPEWDRLAVNPSSIQAWRDISDDYAVRNYECGYNAATVADDGWCVCSLADGSELASGPETGAAGRAAADAALRAMGVLP